MSKDRYNLDTEAVNSAFVRFQETYALHTREEAEQAMCGFLDAVWADWRLYGNAFQAHMGRVCEQALRSLSDLRGFPERLGPGESCEWHIEPVGAALEFRRYDLSTADLSQEFGHRFPADYTAVTLAGSEPGGWVSAAAFGLLLGLSAGQARSLTSRWPGRYLREGGSLVAEGAALWYLEHPSREPFRWPTMFAAPNRCSLA